ncbi:WD40 repeat-like protein [Mycena epipterygia]|nr:WD40 repeat-like protein [Mycena epipterygia]
MASTYSLLVKTVDGVSWKPAPPHHKTPRLYVAIHQAGVGVQRTSVIKGELSPQWDHLSKISSDSPFSTISLKLFHNSSLPFVRDTCLGAADTTIDALLKLCGTGDPKVAKLELQDVARLSKGRPVGTIYVRLLSDDAAAEMAIEQSVSTANNLEAALDSITSKLEIIVNIGDDLAAIHPYANVAWKVLTSVYQAVKKEQNIDDKLCKLVQTMADVYSFVKDVDFLADKMKSVEDKALAIVKQTVECALFIQEYTANGFVSRAVHGSWTDPDGKIEKLSSTLLNLRASFDGSLSVQLLFLSTKVLRGVEGLEQSELLKKLNPANMDATSRPTCLPGTRREILDEIIGWIAVPSDSGSILWLSGVAGSGKSTISTTVSELFRGMDRLGAFLFFDRDDYVRSHPDAVIRTIAHSLALSNPSIGSAISAVIQRDPAIVNAPIQTQFRVLLLEPLQSVEHSIQGPVLIILDALDECGDRNLRAALLSILATEFPKLPRLFRILITSRREQDLTDHFGSCFTEKALDTETSTADVQLFIRHEVDRIRLQRKLGPTWPEEQHIQALVNLAGGLFIWASTAARFIDGYRPSERLKRLITQDFTRGSSLDALYSIALRSSGPWDTDETFAQDARAVLACVVLGRVPMSDGTMDILLGSGDSSSADVLKYLGCVVQWSFGTYARTLHASFADYLTDASRSGGQPWALNTQIEHRFLSLGCLRILNNELRFNICGLEDSHILNADVPDISNRVAAMISPHLAYSSCFWFNHIQEAQSDQMIISALDKLFHRKFLYWLEVLSLLTKIPTASIALRIAAHYVKGYDEDLADFFADAVKFVSAFAPLIAQSATHIYLSAVPFAPQKSRIAQQFAQYFPQTVAFKSILGTNWPSIQIVLHGHTYPVNSVLFSSDSRHIASGGGDATVRVWDAETGGLIAGPFEGHTKSVSSVHFSPNGKWIASGSADNMVRIWDVQTGALVAGPFKGHTLKVTSVHFSPDGARIASGSQDNTVRVWDTESGTLAVGPIEGHTDAVTSVNFSPDGTTIASGSQDCTIHVWDAQTGVLVAGPFEGHTSVITSVHFSPDGARIASGSHDNTVRVWDAESGALAVGPIRGHTRAVTSVSFSPDGARIASGSYDCTVCIWDAQTGVLVAGPFEGHTSSVTSVHFSTDGSRIASGSWDNTVRIWDTQTGTLVSGLFEGHTDEVTCLDLSPDGMRIISGSADKTVRAWDTQTGVLVAGPFEGHTDSVTSVFSSPDGAHIASGSDDGTVRVWDAHTSTLVAGPFGGHSSPFGASVHFSPDGVQIASDDRNHTVSIWDTQINALVAGPFTGHTEHVTSIDFSLDGTQIASGSNDNTVYIWNTQTGALVSGPLEGHTGLVTSVHFSPDGVRIATGSWDKTVRIWDTHDGTLVVGPLEGHTERIKSVHFSPDGLHVASGSWDKTVRVWDAQTGVLIAGPFAGHTDWVTSVCFSRDGKQIISGSVDMTVRISEVSVNPSLESPLGIYPTFDSNTGWVTNHEGQLMFWLPPWLREGLYLPHNTVVIRARGTTKLDLTRFVHGTKWQKCIEPKFRNTK